MIRPLLEKGLEDLGLRDRVPAGAAEKMDRYAALLLEKNRVMNLTAITAPADVAALHFLDCAALLNLLDFTGKRLLDVGTGAGFPGMVLKILVPSLEVTLLDSLNKRLDWLEEVRADLGLEGLHTVHARAEEKSREKDFRETFDVVTSRAVAETRTLCELCLPYVKTGGCMLAMKSVDTDREIAGAEKAIRLLGGSPAEVRDYAVPGTEVRHRAVCVRKASPTPEKYPRAFARIKKSPL